MDWILPLCENRDTTWRSATAASSHLRQWAIMATSSSIARRPRTVRTTSCVGLDPLIPAMLVGGSTPARIGAGDGGADCDIATSLLAASSSSSGIDDVPLSFLTMHPTRPRGEPPSESEARSQGRGVAGPTASISRHRWISDDARGAAGGSSAPHPAPPPHPAPAPDDASDGAGDGSRNTAARAVTGRVADASADSSASLALRLCSCGAGASADAVADAAAAAAAHRSSICFRRLGVGSAAAAAAAPPAASWWWWWWWCWWSGQRGRGDCGGGTRMLKNPLAGCLEDALEGSLHGVESCGMAATEDVAMAPPNSQR